MKQRLALQASLATITVVAAAASAASGNLWIVGALVVCAAAVAARPFAKAIPPEDIAPLFETLRLSRKPGAMAVRAVATPKIIFAGKSAVTRTSNSSYLILFRDEMDVSVWRELSTLLRHQPHDPHELAAVDRHHAFRFGKSSDL